MTTMKVINAPAGSGKSHEIRDIIAQWPHNRPHDKLLCVTYTNRAVAETRPPSGVHNVEVSTIHSYLAEFSKPLFQSKEIVDFYYDINKDAIIERIESKDARIQERNAKYVEKIEMELSFEAIRDSTHSLFYNDSKYDDLYAGGLSHSSLLQFIPACAKKFPKIYKKLNRKYSRIIIDEYQDTHSEIIDFFVTAVANSECELYLYGDRMQQIYLKDSDTLTSLLSNFTEERREVRNYRSSPAILYSLNAIYNNDSLIQKPANVWITPAPRIHVTSTPLETRMSLVRDDTLTLRVHNSSVFSSFGAPTILKTLQNIPAYGYNSRHPAVDVLSEPDWESVHDPVLKLLFCLLTVEKEFQKGNVGLIVQTIRTHTEIFRNFSLSQHADKGHLLHTLKQLLDILSTDKATIGEILSELAKFEKPSFADIDEYLTDEIYSELFDVPFLEVRNTYAHNLKPKLSTQHGVKGESHPAVVFVAEDSPNPLVNMSALLNLWTSHEVNLTILENFHSSIERPIREFESEIGMKVTAMTKDIFEGYEDRINSLAAGIQDNVENTPFFDKIYRDHYRSYFERQNVTRAKQMLKPSLSEGLLAAYKIFYVGCSRARHDLDVIVDAQKLDSPSDTRAHFEQMGFEVRTDSFT